MIIFIYKMDSLNDLQSIMLKYNTDKNSNCHNYGRQYDSLFQKYKNRKVKILELGVYTGQSLPIYKEYFKDYELIVGVDFNPICKQYEDVESRIFVEIGNLSQEEIYSRIIKKYGKFDIIIDDASHQCVDMIKSFEILFKELNDDGLYIIEDTCVYNDPVFNQFTNINILDYMHRYVYPLNQYKIINGHYCVDPFKIQKKTNNYFEYSIDKIEFGVSHIAIHKKIRNHWI